MSRVIEAIGRFAADSPDRIAIESGFPSTLVSYATLSSHITVLTDELRSHNVSTLALAGDNGAGWVVMDLGCLNAGIPVIPVPHFFSPTQVAHLFHAAGVDGVLTDSPESIRKLCEQMKLPHIEAKEITLGFLSLYLFVLPESKTQLPEDCSKVTFTSGSTGEPKGAVLTQQAMEQVASSLAEVTGARCDDRHLSLLPYATLLENIGGLYAPFLVGATICSPGLAAVGLSGSSGLDVNRFMGMLIITKATTCIMIPQMLHALVAAVEAGAPKPETLRYIAVGGAPVSTHLLERAEKLGLPVYEGYGLSEAASVVAVNSEGVKRAGSVGKLLPHVELSFAGDGEILVGGSLFKGYLGEPGFTGKQWPTGDIGHIDEEGFLYLTGRKKHIFITAFGRNVSPEWVERELSIEPAVAQCCVFGEARPFNVAVIVARSGVGEEVIRTAVNAANGRLPDYARVSSWLIADEPFSIEGGLWTGTGRPRRKQIYAFYEEAVEALYKES
ncbi:Long-chain acyl-CoA synthetase (AMP-forming) [Mariprofundus aestuarium]|uniref:Long-chain acyl-CoA synthetase (AMP-forming) n=1 Tax=Mariprofundus aestuarium TaxID=1921086 RepID=A0A2K8KWS2_MARES|nr:AMP-binding protein [Mariprofundus aestuarium]ATX79355.1 Long-chain acyl-CoA synthetase (AMP-forming) [Mariprofundus aestuarium]